MSAQSFGQEAFGPQASQREAPQKQHFHLKPFDELPADISLAVTGTVIKAGDQLSLHYLFRGDLAEVAIPLLSGKEGNDSHREDRLWEQTCFEFFLAGGHSHARTNPYWEFNLAPSGRWNVFSLTGYRQGLQEEQAFSTLPFTVQAVQDQGITLDISLEIGSIIAPDQPLSVGVSMVIVLADGTETFWAIAHPGAAADFHHPDSFVLRL